MLPGLPIFINERVAILFLSQNNNYFLNCNCNIRMELPKDNRDIWNYFPIGYKEWLVRPVCVIMFDQIVFDT